MKKQRKFDVIQSLAKGLVTLFIIIYAGWTVGVSIYRNYQTNQKIDNIKKEIAKLKVSIAEMKNLIVYYKTDGFKEIEARRRLGVKVADEQVVILPKTQVAMIQVDSSPAENNPDNLQNSQSNISLWWRYIFGDK